MRDALVQVWRAMRFEDRAYAEARDGLPGSLRRMLLVVLAVGLIAGLGVAYTGAREAVLGFDAQRLRHEALDRFSNTGRDLPPELPASIREGLQAGVDIGVAVAGLPRPIPYRLSTLIQTVGLWLSQPFALAASWFSYSLMTLIAARLLGGKATVPQMLSATALSNAPYVLNVMQAVPFCGLAVIVTSWAWSSIMFIKGAAVANELSPGRALAAWLLPAVVIVILWSLLIGAFVAGSFLLVLATA